MRSKDITLSASLIALYLTTQLVTLVSPINFSSLMISALFGLFWNYFSLKQNLAFVSGRVAFNVIGSLWTIPKIINYLKIQSTMGLFIYEWLDSFSNVTGVEERAVEMLRALAQVNSTWKVYTLFYLYCVFYALVMPYLFYRVFKWSGLFRRLPKF